MLSKEGIHSGKEMRAFFRRQLLDQLKPVKGIFIDVLVLSILDQVIQGYAGGISDPAGSLDEGFISFLLYLPMMSPLVPTALPRSPWVIFFCLRE
jgi:hypothetical protein